MTWSGQQGNLPDRPEGNFSLLGGVDIREFPDSLAGHVRWRS